MDEKIKNYHKIVYRAMEYQYQNFDILRKLNIFSAMFTVVFSIILLVSKDIVEYIFIFTYISEKLVELIFFIINLMMVISSILWLIITSKYDITSIGIKAEKYKNIQNKIFNSKDMEEAEKYFLEYERQKPEYNDLLFNNREKINKKLIESGKSDYCFIIESRFSKIKKFFNLKK